MKHTLRFNAQTGTVELAIEAAAPLFCVCVATSIEAAFLEAPGSVAILTTSQPTEKSTDKALATYRCFFEASCSAESIVSGLSCK